MQPPTFDLDVLRSFTVGLELGSFAKAARRLGLSTSAVSAQLKKLEEQVGSPILRKSGRGLALTPTGEVLLSYARRLLALNDEAATAVRSADLKGAVRLGLQEDFGEGLLAGVLGAFARAHPQVRIEARLTRNAELLEQVQLGRLDLVLAWDAGTRTAHVRRVGEVPLCWIGASDTSVEPRASGEPLPLVAIEAPCLMRSIAVAALDKARIPWRLAFTSASLGGVWAAVGAGLGVTVRTRAGLPAHLQVLDSMPALPAIGLDLHRAEAEPAPAVRRLEEMMLAHLHAWAPALGASRSTPSSRTKPAND
ncbi:LysR family transcriptional regulator [Pyxidicoccus parkwayensis]|uniref:LysR family transcriptional regulator n=1 Tax=Pyxidicoccus parkwayensis TaxID=2813578 RepID=A0ABX7NZJ6_9BACT|nr:LysR substrate-binding domain-containing protein [Pyxidicoccus parkwaysis]QSQ22912.1 LysR family transcriptional regulator [Pyxidicoccus parkwaysis]